MALKNELPTILPFYKNLKNQIRWRENNTNLESFKNYTMQNKIIPFCLQLPKDSNPPTKWELRGLDGNNIDLINNINKLNAHNFDDFCYVFYHGEILNFDRAGVLEELKLCVEKNLKSLEGLTLEQGIRLIRLSVPCGVGRLNGLPRRLHWWKPESEREFRAKRSKVSE